MQQTTNAFNTSHEIVVIIRPSFKKLCGQDACRAALFNHLLYWIAQKARGQPEDKIKSGEVYWYGSAQEICTGLNDSWTIWKVRKEIRALTEGTNALIGQRHNPREGWDREYQYFFGEKQGQILRAACQANNICLRHLGLSTDVLHLLATVGAFAGSSKCNCGIQQMDLLDPTIAFTGSSNAIPKDYTKITPKITAKDYTNAADSTDSANQTQQQSDGKEQQSQHKSPQASTIRDIALTTQGQHILKLYNKFKGRTAIKNAATLLAANKLGEVVNSDEDFLAVLKAIANDPFLKQKQVRTDLDFVYRKYDGFLDIVEHARSKQLPDASNTQTDYNEVAGMTDEQRAAYKQQQQEKLQQAQPPGIDRATLMKLKPEERIALLKKIRERKT